MLAPVPSPTAPSKHTARAFSIEPGKTLEDFRALPEGTLAELIDGDLILMAASPTPLHQRVSARLSFALYSFVQEHGLGEVLSAPLDVFLTETNAFQPDIFFLSNERQGIIEERVEGAPDLVGEILSPSTGYYDLTKKRRVYQEHGVKEYWIVDPMERCVEVLWNSSEAFERVAEARGEGAVASRLLDGFTVELNSLFPARKK